VGVRQSRITFIGFRTARILKMDGTFNPIKVASKVTRQFESLKVQASRDIRYRKGL